MLKNMAWIDNFIESFFMSQLESTQKIQKRTIYRYSMMDQVEFAEDSL